MKIQKLILRAATAGLLFGAPSAVLAVDCAGIINDEIVRNVTVGQGASCILTESNVRGDIVATGAAVVVMVGNNVDGQVLIEESTVVAIQGNDLWDGNLIVRTSGQVAVVDNNVEGRIAINKNTAAVVTRNSSNSDIVCRSNDALDASFNRAKGNDNCED